ncbi:helix-hairpin-helix domain-containing protein [Flavobacterium columnare]|uniref:Helix-hairpin-helix domain-containing protein n=1 Tax=Flavobacterium columnare TaxID=996 RepID=A0A437U7I2_9FLAO|nr:helix-hairpin-helix domain-containing protein [Flavobacterium columnare]RVU89626.1 helix-hairpin-helix domain-containing protein [Flavobacterium columnare]
MRQSLKKYFEYTKNQQIALLCIIILSVLLQTIYTFVDFSEEAYLTPEEKKWLAKQIVIDSLKKEAKKEKYKIQPFNPNFITDFKGYKLGMSIEEINRLLAYRKKGKYVNSSKEFQEITQISDSLLASMASYFKFPDWVLKNKNKNKEETTRFTVPKQYNKRDTWVKKDINLATKEDLMKVYGIGDVISDRILKNRETLGGFVSMEQLQDVWGLSPEVILELNKKFILLKIPEIVKLKINEASSKELLKIPYLKYPVVREIVGFRSMNNGIHSVEDLLKIKTFPVDKVKIIALYLDFK